MLKITLSFVLIFVAVSLNVATVSGNKADDQLKKLREKVDEALKKAQEQLDAAKAKINEIAAQTQEAAKKQMQSTIDSIRSQIDELKCKAKSKGVNIDECLGKNEEQLLALPDKFSGDMVHCVSDRINEAIGHVQCALDKIKKIVDEVENLKQEIHNCGHGFRGAKCIAELAVRIEKDITTLPESIAAEATATVVLITHLEERVKECSSTKTNDCESEGKSILEKISACVAKKIVIG